MTTDTAAKRDKAITEARKVAERLEGGGLTEDERGTAMQRLANLMRRWDLDDSIIARREGRKRQAPVYKKYTVSDAGGFGRERTAVIGHMAAALGGKYVCNWVQKYSPTTGQKAGKAYTTTGVVASTAVHETLALLVPLVMIQMEGAVGVPRRAHLDDLRASDQIYQQYPTKLHVKSRYFTATFFQDYGYTVAHRLRQGVQAAQQEAIEAVYAEHGETEVAGAELAIIDDAAAVKRTYIAMFPSLTSMRSRKFTSDSGARAGREAGERADLGDGKLGGVPRKELAN